ncbi:Filamentous hemagglutinin [Pararobbsia alpina]|uniref:two-partner secretion domain-containing protein n=1 Tax=Pararobbsia alpina TaxID=621374 RepID=UPI0039A601F3
MTVLNDTESLAIALSESPSEWRAFRPLHAGPIRWRQQGRAQWAVSASTSRGAEFRAHRTTISALVTLALAFWACPHAHAEGLPTGGHFVAGSGSIATAPFATTITQTSQRGIVDWNSFSIGNGNTVMFNNGSGATLNRVTGGNASTIIGRLSATGSVYLINPQGIVVGPTGVVSTGGRFVASTLDVDNNAFMQGGALTLSGNSDVSVTNLGTIHSASGDVFLIARTTAVNKGTIDAPNGTVEMATGQQVLLKDSSTGSQVSVQVGSGGSVMNFGTITAAQANLAAADGNVYALAGNNAAIRANGTATRDGHIWLVAEQGKVSATSGTIEASNVDGTAGTVETNSTTLSLGTATVLAGNWLLTTPVFKIDDATAATLERSLDAGTSINVITTATGSSGNVNVLSNVEWTGGASLAINAEHSVIIDPNVTVQNTGTGNLTLRADRSALDNGGGVANFGTIDWSHSTGNVAMMYDMNGSFTPGTELSNAAWTPPAGSGLVDQITAYELVNSLTDLKNVSNNLAGNYALGIDLIDRLDPTQSFNPFQIGQIGSADTPFTGQFDGLGHTIDTVYAPTTATPPANYGLFGEIGTTGVVRNLGVTNAQNNTGAAYNAAGVLAGINDGTIVNSFTSGSVTWSPAVVAGGGLVGINNGLIENSSSTVTGIGTGTPTNPRGEIAGENNGTIVTSVSP